MLEEDLFVRTLVNDFSVFGGINVYGCEREILSLISRKLLKFEDNCKNCC